MSLFCWVSSPEVWEESFRDVLFIRQRSQHTRCSICVRHKLVLKRLRRNLPARKAQMDTYRAHLRKQYEDRVRYWKSRSDSRMAEATSEGVMRIAVTIDSIDHSKFAWPRATAMDAKEFGQFIRPTLGVTAALIHGYAVLFFVSEPHMAHDSSWTSEIIACCLNFLKDKFPLLDMRNVHLSCHGDNSSKELKNNSVMRLLSGLVAVRRLKGASLGTLQSGHSHEDIDQMFSSLATHIRNESELHCPSDFVQSIQSWLDPPQTRPSEKFKRCFKLDQVRAWILGMWMSQPVAASGCCFSNMHPVSQANFSRCTWYFFEIPHLVFF